MDSFTVLHGRAAPLMRENIDTDAIISAQAMVGGQVADPGKVLFTAWRYRADGTENPGFILNQARYRGACALIAGRNFGCGSSREHAVWALVGYGIRCVIAPSFGEIFYDNAFQNGLLPAIVAQEEARRIADALERAPAADLTIDLAATSIILPDGGTLGFSVPPERREALLHGLDDLSFLLRRQSETDDWARRDEQRRPWIWSLRSAP